MCLNCGAWTTGGSRLLAEPCDHVEVTEARARGLSRFLRGLHPGKATTLAKEWQARQDEVQLVMDRIHTPQLGTKRVSRAIEVATKLAKKQSCSASSQGQDTSAPGTVALVRPTSPSTPFQVSALDLFDDPEADLDIEEELYPEPPPQPDRRVSGLSSSTSPVPPFSSASARPKRLSREQRHEQQALGLARVVNNLKKRLKRFQ